MTLAAAEEAKLAKLYPVAEELVASLGGACGLQRERAVEWGLRDSGTSSHQQREAILKIK